MGKKRGPEVTGRKFQRVAWVPTPGPHNTTQTFSTGAISFFIILLQSPKFYNIFLPIVGLTTLGTLVNFYWFIPKDKCSNVSATNLQKG